MTDQSSVEASSAEQHSPVCVALVNDFELILAGLTKMLTPFGQRVQVVELDARTTPEHNVDVALLDTFGHVGLGLDRVAAMAADDRVHHVAVYSFSFSQPLVDAALQRGATGYLSKSLSASQLVDDIERIARGEQVVTGPVRGVAGNGHAWPGNHLGLSQRESELLALVVSGLRNSEIARALFVSENTVKTHLRHVYRKLGVHNRAQAVALAMGDSSFRKAAALASPG